MHQPNKAATKPKLQDASQPFLPLAHKVGALRLGDFTLKSGRQSPYFFNAGHFATGPAMHALGQAYAHTIAASKISFDMLLGPAYKGIPLAVATAMALHAEHGIDVPFGFDRKEVKSHGDKGSFVGSSPKGRVFVVDDVITAGTAIQEILAKIQDAGAELAGICVALDRQELPTAKGDAQDSSKSKRSAIDHLRHTLGVPVLAIATLDDLIAYLDDPTHDAGELSQHRKAMHAYRATYGAPKT